MSRPRLASLSLLAVALAAAPADAEFIPLLTFEVNEALGANNGGVVGSFGATEGASALVFANKAAGGATFFDIGTVTGNSVGESLNNYNAFLQAVQGAATQDVYFQYDVTFDATNLTSGGFQQLGTFANSENGWNDLGWGATVAGNHTWNPPVATLSAPAVTAGATITLLDPIDYAADDVGAFRVSIPFGPGKLMNVGDGGDEGFDFAQLGFTKNDGYGGTVTFAFDRVGFQVGPVPEPASAAFIAIGAVMLLRRRP